MRANIDAVRRNPSMPEAQRRAILDDVAREQEDLVAVLDALQALARGDAAAALPREAVDMAEVLDAAVEAARAAASRGARRRCAPPRART